MTAKVRSSGSELNGDSAGLMGRGGLFRRPCTPAKVGAIILPKGVDKTSCGSLLIYSCMRIEAIKLEGVGEGWTQGKFSISKPVRQKSLQELHYKTAPREIAHSDHNLKTSSFETQLK